MIKDFLNGINNLIFPANCLSCKKHCSTQKPSDVLCLSCQEAIQFNRTPFCPKCSRSLGEKFDRVKCAVCAEHPPVFDFAWGSCLYDEHLRHLIHSFKYNQKTSLRRPFAQRMIKFIKTHNFDIAQFDYLMPIPLFPTRQRERGYNQSYLLAQLIGQHFDIPLSTKSLKRVHHTETQTRFTQKERWTNIHDAFRIKNSAEIDGKNILLLDDLLTTGATSSEAARTLKKSGAQTVGVLTLAITV